MILPNNINKHCSTQKTQLANGISSSYDILDGLNISIPVPSSLKELKPLTSLEVLDKYTESRLKLKRSKLKNINQDHNKLKKVLQIIGFDNLNDIDRYEAENIANALYVFPKNSSKYKEFDELNGLDIIIKNQQLDAPKAYLSEASVKGYIQKLSTFFRWAKYHNSVNNNVFYRIPLKKPDSNKKRFCFSEKQLIDIFNLRHYKINKYLHPYYYWIPLLLRYTGSRLNELCQALACDVQVIDGVFCIIIRETTEDQSIKTSSSNRIIPIHDELISKGFVEFVESRSGGRLFPEQPLIEGYYSHNASNWLSRCREKLGLGKGFDAHSFRHNFIDELKQNGVSRELIESLAGHEHDSESLDTYGKQYNPNILLPIVNVINSSHTKSIMLYKA
ncbi:site-specific integrase [Vibrio parahaemolyticus]